MSTALATTVREQVEAARRARDEGIARAEDGDLTGWDRKLIDQAIAAFAGTGRPFSANDLRDLLPDVRPALMGARFRAAAQRLEIKQVGFTTSTKKNTHAKAVALWQKIPDRTPVVVADQDALW